MVVEEPAECQDCSQLCCGACIEQWRQRNNTCPNCRGNLNIGKKLNRFVLQSLNSSEFACDTCSTAFNYEQRRQHWQACGKSLKCPLNCANGAAQFATMDALKEHWLKECEMMELVCSVCCAQTTRPGIAEHNCEAGLLKLVEQLRQRNKELLEENAQLKSNRPR